MYLFCFYYLIFFTLFKKNILFSFAFLTEPKIVYVDGSQPWDNCRPGLKRSLISLNGLLLSHPFYGSLPYNSSRNCFLTIAVPIGYRVRLKALDFDVKGQWGKCEREDTLHIFDHDQQLEPEILSINEQLPIGGHSPGRLLGEFCGKIEGGTDSLLEKTKKDSLMAESTKNALTLWWHTEEENKQTTIGTSFINNNNKRINNVANGFRLLWSSFRTSYENCKITKNKKQLNNNITNLLEEFQCIGSINSSKIVECIPSQLGCNSYADCFDNSDLDPQIQLKHGCEHIPNVPLNVLINSGPKRLLLCSALLLVWFTVFIGCCCCYINYRKKKIKKKHSSSLNNTKEEEKENNFKNKKQLNERGHLFFRINEGNNIQQQQNGNNLLIPKSQPPPPPPLLPPPKFSPPILKNTKRLPLNLINQQTFENFQELKNQNKLTKNKQKSISNSSNSQSSSSQKKQQKSSLNNNNTSSTSSSFEQNNNLLKRINNFEDINNYLYLKEQLSPQILTPLINIRGKQKQQINNILKEERHLII